jgi:hypothetical protein
MPIEYEAAEKIAAASHQYLRHFSETLDFACASRTQNQGFQKNGEHIYHIEPILIST